MQFRIQAVIEQHAARAYLLRHLLSLCDVSAVLLLALLVGRSHLKLD
jgi:hypothetical protein